MNSRLAARMSGGYEQRNGRGEARDEIRPSALIAGKNIIVVLFGNCDRRRQRYRALLGLRGQETQQLERIARDRRGWGWGDWSWFGGPRRGLGASVAGGSFLAPRVGRRETKDDSDNQTAPPP